MAKLTSKGQLTLPKSIRDRLNLEKGSYIAIYLEKDQLVMKKVNPRRARGETDPVWDMVGVMQGGGHQGSSPDPKSENKVISIRETAKWKHS